MIYKLQRQCNANYLGKINQLLEARVSQQVQGCRHKRSK